MGSHYDIPMSSDSEADEASDMHAHPKPTQGNLGQMLRETTHVAGDGAIHYSSRLVDVPASPKRFSSKTALKPDVVSVEAAPVFDLLEDEGFASEEEEDAARALRESVCLNVCFAA